MYTNPDGQFTAIIRYRPFSIYKILGLKNDISITKSVNVHVLDTFNKSIFITLTQVATYCTVSLFLLVMSNLSLQRSGMFIARTSFHSSAPAERYVQNSE